MFRKLATRFVSAAIVDDDDANDDEKVTKEVNNDVKFGTRRSGTVASSSDIKSAESKKPVMQIPAPSTTVIRNAPKQEIKTLKPTVDKLKYELVGTVASLHLHPDIGRDKSSRKMNPMKQVKKFSLVEGKGILDCKRYFGKLTRSGLPSPRQMSLITRKLLKYHEETLLVYKKLNPGDVRSNMEIICDLDLVEYLEREFVFGNPETGPRIIFTIQRDPCMKMDIIAPGLQENMLCGLQGVLSSVTKSGDVFAEDEIYLVL